MHRHTIPLRLRFAGVKPGTVVAPTEPPTPAPPTILPALGDLLAALGRILQEARKQDADARREVALHTVELAVALAEHLLKTEIAADRQRLDRIVTHALERIASRGKVTLRANTEDAALLSRQLAENEELAQARGLLTVQADGSLPRGQLTLDAADCFVEWNTQRSLAELRNVLLEEVQ
jgi:flagellar biosynthesis/type III secretory pathway protein FliH